MPRYFTEDGTEISESDYLAQLQQRAALGQQLVESGYYSRGSSGQLVENAELQKARVDDYIARATAAGYSGLETSALVGRAQWEAGPLISEGVSHPFVPPVLQNVEVTPGLREIQGLQPPPGPVETPEMAESAMGNQNALIAYLLIIYSLLRRFVYGS